MPFARLIDHMAFGLLALTLVLLGVSLATARGWVSASDLFGLPGPLVLLLLSLVPCGLGATWIAIRGSRGALDDIARSPRYIVFAIAAPAGLVSLIMTASLWGR